MSSTSHLQLTVLCPSAGDSWNDTESKEWTHITDGTEDPTFVSCVYFGSHVGFVSYLQILILGIEK